MKIPKKLRDISKLETKSLAERGLKLSEETGELAAAIFKHIGKKKTSESKAATLLNLKEEAVDCLIMSLDILAYVGTRDPELTSYLEWKLDKWYKNMEK